MSIVGIIGTLAQEAGVTAEDILNEAGLDREGAVRYIAKELGVEVAPPEGAVEVVPDDIAKVREGLSVLNRIFQ